MARGFFANLNSFFKHGLNMKVGSGKQLGDVFNVYDDFFKALKSFGKHGLNMELGNGKQLGDMLRSTAASYTQSELTGAAREQNEWTAEREDSQYQRSVADMQAAGLNPALMYQSGASGTSVSPSAGNGAADIGQIMQLMTLPLQIAQMHANIDATEAATDKTRTETDWLPALSNARSLADLSTYVYNKAKSALTDEQRLSIIQQYHFAEEMFPLIREEKEATIARLRKLNELTDEEVKNAVAERGLTEAKVEYIASQTGLNEAEIHRIAMLLPLELCQMDADIALKEMMTDKYAKDIALAGIYAMAALNNSKAAIANAGANAYNAKTNAKRSALDLLLKLDAHEWDIFFKKAGLELNLGSLDVKQQQLFLDGIRLVSEIIANVTSAASAM